jgi:hypothetical protein
MKSFSKILIAGLIAGGVSAPALAQVTAGQSTTASITIIRPIVLTKVTDLVFGTVTRPASGTNTVTMGVASDTPTTSVANSLITTGAGSTRSRASYTVTGETGRTVAITLSNSTIQLTRVSGSETLDVDLTLEAATDTLTGGSGSFSGDGTLYVGGEIDIASTTVVGDYTGSFTTTVAYN